MLIALDYDMTYTLDPEFWNEFISNAKLKNHEVICITMRYNIGAESEDVMNSIGKICSVFFSGRKAKREYINTMNIFPDIWIDDSPHWILNNG